MQPIKVRAWDVIEKKMLYGYNIHVVIDQHIINQIIKKRYIVLENLFEKLFIQGLKLMQYTGLKDKNGKGQEIYQSDICEFDYMGKKLRAEVILKEGIFGFWLENLVCPLSEYLHQNLKVIGNAYENSNYLNNN